MPSAPSRRALSLGAAVLALLAVVGRAARGHRAGGGGGPPRHVPTDIVLEYVLLLMALGAVLVLPLVFMAFRQAREEPDTLPRRGNWMMRLFVATALISAALTARAIYRHLHHQHPPN